MNEREIFEAWATTLDLDLTPIAGGHYSDRNTDFAWLAWSAACRTTPDREAIIEECMQVCRTIAEYFEEESPPQVSPTRKQAAGARVCLAAIKQIKTAPTPHQSAALDRLAENNHELGLDYLTAPTSDQGEKS